MKMEAFDRFIFYQNYRQRYAVIPITTVRGPCMLVGIYLKPVRSQTFVEIDCEIISTAILLPSADSFKKVCCQLQAKVCARITG